MSAGRIIVAPASEAEDHAADRILGALASAAAQPRECLGVAELGEGAVAPADLLLLVCGADWEQRVAEPAVAALLADARERGCTVELILLDEAAEPDAVDLAAEQAWLQSLGQHAVRHAHWASDVADLTSALEPPPPQASGPLRVSSTRQILLAAGLLGILVVLGGLLVMSRMWSEPPAVVGRWVAQVDYGRSVVHEERFEFRLTGGQITGSATWQGSRRIIETAVQDGERLSFHTRSHENRGSERRELRHDYVGIVSGDTLQFQLRSSGGFEERETVQFEARRAP